MGFWDAVGKCAKVAGKGAMAVGSSLLEQTREASELADSWEGKDKEFIHNKYKNGNVVEKMAATKVAKQNGWKK
ncbi:Uncharacterised protein [Yersinia frederiksenii]|nr:Uncharacterised protein [Yersinia frederiksenii]CNI27883.1 Uncharacterised protein [Yersinia frederiksenii]